MTDEEIEAIHEAAYEAAQGGWLGNVPANPYPADPDRAEVWDYAFRNAFANQNH